MPARRYVHRKAAWHSFDITVLQVIFPVDVPHIILFSRSISLYFQNRITFPCLGTRYLTLLGSHVFFFPHYINIYFFCVCKSTKCILALSFCSALHFLHTSRKTCKMVLKKIIDISTTWIFSHIHLFMYNSVSITMCKTLLNLKHKIASKSSNASWLIM